MFCAKPEAIPFPVTAGETSLKQVAFEFPISLHFEGEMPAMPYSEKESSLGFGRDDGESLAGKESAIVLSSIFSRFAFELAGSTIRSSGSLPGLFEIGFPGAVFLRTIILHSCVGPSPNIEQLKLAKAVLVSHSSALPKRVVPHVLCGPFRNSFSG